MENNLNQIFDKWLFNKNDKSNPFVKMFSKIGEDLPKVPLPDSDEKWRCIECGEIRKDDPRVSAGMKCGFCAYSNSVDYDQDAVL